MIIHQTELTTAWRRVILVWFAIKVSTLLFIVAAPATIAIIIAIATTSTTSVEATGSSPSS